MASVLFWSANKTGLVGAIPLLLVTAVVFVASGRPIRTAKEKRVRVANLAQLGLAIVYWIAASYVLFRYAPPMLDDENLITQTLHWGVPQNIHLEDLYHREFHYNMVFALPYAVAGSVLSLAGCVIPGISVSRFQKLRDYPFAAGATTALVAIGTTLGINDVLTSYHLWDGPLLLRFWWSNGDWIWWDSWTIERAICYFVPLAVLSGLFMAGLARLTSGGPNSGEALRPPR